MRWLEMSLNLATWQNDLFPVGQWFGKLNSIQFMHPGDEMVALMNVSVGAE